MQRTYRLNSLQVFEAGDIILRVQGAEIGDDGKVPFRGQPCLSENTSWLGSPENDKPTRTVRQLSGSLACSVFCWLTTFDYTNICWSYPYPVQFSQSLGILELLWAVKVQEMKGLTFTTWSPSCLSATNVVSQSCGTRERALGKWSNFIKLSNFHKQMHFFDVVHDNFGIF